MTEDDARTRLGALLFDGLWPGLDEAGLNVVEYDPGWQSPCQLGEPTPGGVIRWKPVPMEQAPDFTELERALTRIGATLHPDVPALYGSFWCGPVDGLEHSGETVSLCTVWNADELRRTVHGLAEQARQAGKFGDDITFPVASAYGDLFFVLDNATGSILLQEIGHRGGRKVAPSLAQFLADL
ncbi:SecY-interacting protein Syd [Kitasatospora sp. MAP5-34]|uniref:SecY-interacting protein Syd n=1 Tax=Kitasatospora sp. MAP5-34 TaxID=3035102 RepID=UPI0024748E76|nr:SecY-interacting protein Syd [Kitasatospora sp. MAP5-34]MDH6580747.1 SecY interacting protein Syd [Kitasatospora sp. MAP5-34]